MKSMVIFHSYVNVYQRATPRFLMRWCARNELLCTSPSATAHPTGGGDGPVPMERLPGVFRDTARQFHRKMVVEWWLNGIQYGKTIGKLWFNMGFYGIYRLVNFDISMEHHIFLRVNSLFLWPCSIFICKIPRASMDGNISWTGHLQVFLIKQSSVTMSQQSLISAHYLDGLSWDFIRNGDFCFTKLEI